MRGEYVFDLFEFSAIMGSPPHARGIRLCGIKAGSRSGITPACAGNTSVSHSSGFSHRDHPRMRGEYPETFASPQTHAGSPPHARGILPPADLSEETSGITPACAGNTFLTFLNSLPSWDHPRMRGEYQQWDNMSGSDRGSPPLFFVKYFSLKKASEFPIFSKGFSLLSAGIMHPCA